jgi:hypothetical protein
MPLSSGRRWRFRSRKILQGRRMHPRIASFDPSRLASPSASLGVPVGSPTFAGATARTAHAPSADADDAAGPDVAPFAPSADSPTDGERLAPVGTPDDEGLSAEGPGAPGSFGAQSSATRDVEGGGDSAADLADVIDAGDGAAPADAASRGGPQG